MMKLKSLLKFLDYDPIEHQTKVCGLISVTEYLNMSYRKIRHQVLNITDPANNVTYSYENIIHAYGTLWKVEQTKAHEYIFREYSLVDIFCRPENFDAKEEQMIWVGCADMQQFSDRVLIADDGTSQYTVTAARHFRSWTGDVCITIE